MAGNRVAAVTVTMSEDDPSWGIQELFPGQEKLKPDKVKQLEEKLEKYKLVCMWGGDILVFNPSLCFWSSVHTSSSAVFINSITGNENASVAYLGSLRPYISNLYRMSLSNIASAVPTSICVGCQRLAISRYDSQSMELEPCKPILSSMATNPKMHTLAAMCVKPVLSKVFLPQWDLSHSTPACDFISQFLMDKCDLKTIMWCVGNSLLDPSDASKALIFSGPGGRGKSNIMNCIKDTLVGASSAITPDMLYNTNKSDGKMEKLVDNMISFRIVSAGDVDSGRRGLDYSVIKNLTGHEYMSTSTGQAKTACTLMYSCNKLEDPSTNHIWRSEALMRRAVVVWMDKVLPEVKSLAPQTDEERLSFMYRCVHTRLIHKDMPISPLNVLFTLLGCRAKDALAYFREDDPDRISPHQALVATTLVGVKMEAGADAHPHAVGELARAISRSSVKTVQGMYVIKGIALSSMGEKMYGNPSVVEGETGEDNEMVAVDDRKTVIME